MSHEATPSRTSLGPLLFGVVVAVVLVSGLFLTTVSEGEVAVVTTLGRPRATWTTPGLYAHAPWPIQTVYRFDRRMQLFETGLEQTLTRDGRPVVVALFAQWRIADAIRFLERVGTPDIARRNLNGLLGHWRNAVFGRYAFDTLINTDTNRWQLPALEEELARAVRAEALERYGIEVAAVGIRVLTLPPGITEKVYQRMRAERQVIAEAYRAQGEAEAARIRAEANSLRDCKLAEAEATALRLRAEGDAAAAEAYAVFERNPDLALFLRKLDVLEETIGRRTTLVLGLDSPPFDLLRGGVVLTNPVAPAVHAPRGTEPR
jgi:membrane protease subunit HflC